MSVPVAELIQPSRKPAYNLVSGSSSALLDDVDEIKVIESRTKMSTAIFNYRNGAHSPESRFRPEFEDGWEGMVQMQRKRRTVLTEESAQHVKIKCDYFQGCTGDVCECLIIIIQPFLQIR